MRALVAAVCSAAVLLTCPVPAGASARDDGALAIGWTYWTLYAPFQVIDLATVCGADAVEIRWVDYHPAGGVAAATVDGCRTGSPYIRAYTGLADARWLRFCRVVTHEYGHLVGFLHSRNTKNIMASGDGWWGDVPSAATTSRAEQLCRRLGSTFR